MRTVFMGTPAYALPCLEALLDLQYQVVGTVTQPDKTAGRGRALQVPPVKRFAQAHGLPVLQPPSLRDPQAVEQLAALHPQLIVVAAYGKILPPPVLALPPRGCLNVHPSLLPRHRGAAPVATAILEGDVTTGVSLMMMDAGMDTGPLLAQQEEPVRPQDTTESLTDRLFRRSSKLLRELLPRYLAGEVRPRPQPLEGATTTRMLRKEDGEVDWEQNAEALERRLRAFTPWPGCFTYWHGRLLKLLEAHVEDDGYGEQRGRVLALELEEAPAGVVTSRGVLALRRVQLEGKRPLTCAEFVRGHRSFVGAVLPS